MRVQVKPYSEFGQDVSWITQEVIEGYIFASLRGEQFAHHFLGRYCQGIAARKETFFQCVLNDPDYLELFDQIWEEMQLPARGTIEYHIWQIERAIESPRTPIEELSKLYKILGEYRGWLTKPGEKASAVAQVNLVGNDPIADIRNMNANDAERVYYSIVAGAGR